MRVGETSRQGEFEARICIIRNNLLSLEQKQKQCRENSHYPCRSQQGKALHVMTIHRCSVGFPLNAAKQSSKLILVDESLILFLFVCYVSVLFMCAYVC